MVIASPPAIVHAQPAKCTQAAEDEPFLCPLKLPAVRSVVIERNAGQAWTDKAQPVSCRGFVLGTHQVTVYLAGARQTDAQSVHYTLAESPCYAAGRVRFVDGRVARWRIDQFRIGRLTFVPGRTIILYCPDCRIKPFGE